MNFERVVAMDKKEAQQKCAIFEYLENINSENNNYIKQLGEELKAHNKKQDIEMQQIKEKVTHISENGFKSDLANIFIKKLQAEQEIEKGKSQVIIKKQNLWLKILTDLSKVGIGLLIGYLSLKGWL